MCLSTVKWAIDRCPIKICAGGNIGWKCLDKHGDGYTSPVFHDGPKYQPGIWYKSKVNDRLIAGNDHGYENGFHIYKTRADARLGGWGNAMVKVYYRDVVAVGTEGESTVIIAKEMMVIPPVTKKFPKRPRWKGEGMSV